MKSFIDALKRTDVPALYATEDVSLEDKCFYGHIFTTALEWWDYHAYISEYDPNTNIAFWFVSWQDNEWGTIDLREIFSVPLVMVSTYQGSPLSYKDMMKSIAYKQE